MALTSMSNAGGNRSLDHRTLLLIPLSLPLSSLDFQDCQIIEKGGLESYIRDFITRPGHGPHLPPFHQNTVDGANLTANKAGKVIILWGQEKSKQFGQHLAVS